MSFPIGSMVMLRFCPNAGTGRVVGCQRGRILVLWDDLGLTTKHKAESLIGEKSEGPL